MQQPQQTFTKDDVDKLAKFFNFVQARAKFEMTGREAQDYYLTCHHVTGVIRKIEQNIMELVGSGKIPETASTPGDSDQ